MGYPYESTTWKLGREVRGTVQNLSKAASQEKWEVFPGVVTVLRLLFARTAQSTRICVQSVTGLCMK